MQRVNRLGDTHYRTGIVQQYPAGCSSNSAAVAEESTPPLMPQTTR